MRLSTRWILLVAFALLRPGLPGTDSGWFQAASPNVVIRSPVGGEAVQGTVAISGNANPVGLAKYEIAFGYTGDETGTWFVIGEGSEPVRSGTLAEWDTFQITDGDYTLRLLVSLEDGRTFEDRVEGIRVRNYSQVETSTPAPLPTGTATPTPDLTALFTPSSTPIATGTPAPPPTATALPPNPATFKPGDISLSMARGAAGVLAAFILLGIYTSLRSVRRR